MKQESSIKDILTVVVGTLVLVAFSYIYAYGQPIGYHFDIVNVPELTSLNDLNSSELVGVNRQEQGVLIDANQNVTPITCGGQFTFPQSVNKRSTVAGRCALPVGGDQVLRGFLLTKQGRWTFFTTPLNKNGIGGPFVARHNDLDDVVGQYPIVPDDIIFGPPTRFQGFLWSKGQLTDLSCSLAPDAVLHPQGINARKKIVGYGFANGDDKPFGFLLDNGNCLAINFPDGAVPLDINNDDQILGGDPEGIASAGGYVLDDDIVWKIGKPEPSQAGATVGVVQARGFYDDGRIVGKYTESIGFTTKVFHFVATPEMPSRVKNGNGNGRSQKR